MRKIYAYFLIFLLASILLSLFLGLDFSNAPLILKELRVPRLITALAVGAALSLSGVVMQTVLSNPLAEPYTLGIASGAALGAAISTSLGFKFAFFGLNAGAVLGSMAVLFILLKLVVRGGRQNDSMILLGVMLSLTCASMLAVWMALADPLGVQSITFWLLGDLSRVDLTAASALLALTLIIGAYFILFSKKLDAFIFGENLVETFGVSFERTQKISILLISILVGFCVSAVGMIGFVGLMLPHLVRKIIQSTRHRQLIPLSMLGGASILTFSDAIARRISEPHELPVGAVMAMVGAPVFIYIFIHLKRGSLR